MENIIKFMHMAFAALLFCIGLFLLINSTVKYSNMIAQVREERKEDVLYQQYYTGEITVSYAGLIAMLLEHLDYDIEINGLSISKATHAPDKISTYGIENSQYDKSYQYDDAGHIKKIIYTKML